jgi:hypothetical protein
VGVGRLIVSTSWDVGTTVLPWLARASREGGTTGALLLSCTFQQLSRMIPYPSMAGEVSVLPLILLITSLRFAARSPTVAVAGQRRGAASTQFSRKHCMCRSAMDGLCRPAAGKRKRVEMQLRAHGAASRRGRSDSKWPHYSAVRVDLSCR